MLRVGSQITLHPHPTPTPYTHTLHPHPSPTPYTHTLHPYPAPTPYTQTLHPHPTPTQVTGLKVGDAVYCNVGGATATRLNMDHRWVFKMAKP